MLLTLMCFNVDSDIEFVFGVVFDFEFDVDFVLGFVFDFGFCFSCCYVDFVF